MGQDQHLPSDRVRYHGQTEGQQGFVEGIKCRSRIVSSTGALEPCSVEADIPVSEV